MKYLAKIFFLFIWVCGLVLAKGFWSTFFAVIFPLWGWYLVAEKSLQYFGVIQ